MAMVEHFMCNVNIIIISRNCFVTLFHHEPNFDLRLERRFKTPALHGVCQNHLRPNPVVYDVYARAILGTRLHI